MKKFDLKGFYPHILAVLAFMVMTGIYFAPTFQGKDLVQDDALNSRGWGEDLRKYHEETGEYAHWSNSMFGGMPANYTYMPKSVNFFRSMGDFVTLKWLGATGRHNGYIFFSLVGFYVFLISIGCTSWLAFMGAVAYTFCSYNFVIINAGHVNKALVMATMAPIIGGVIMCYRGRLLWGSIVTLFFAGLNIYWNHQQISYYLLLILIILAVVYLVYAIREKALKSYFKATAVLLVTAILALLPSLGQLLPTLDYTKESVRGGAVLQQTGSEKATDGLEIDYAYAWSYGIDETLTLLIPNMYGGSSHYDLGTDSETYKIFSRAYGPAQAKQIVKLLPAYWGAQPFTSGPVYVGAVVCFLFVLGFCIVKGRERWWLALATLLSFVLAWGKYLPIVNDFLFYNLPLYNKFRAPSMALVIASLTMVALGVLAVKEILEHIGSEQFKKNFSRGLVTAFALTGGLTLLFALFGGSLFSFEAPSDASYPAVLVDALRADRADMLTGDAWRSFLFIALAFAALYACTRSWLKPNHTVVALSLLVLVDLWAVDKRFLSWDTFVPKREATEFVATSVDRQILRDKHPDYRVLNLATSTFNDSRTSYFHKSVGGYSPAKLRRYQDIIEWYFSGDVNMNIINMLNVRYVISPSENGSQEVQMNPSAYGNCWFVDNIVWTDSPDEEIAAIGTGDLLSDAYIENSWSAFLPDADSYCNPVDSTAFIRLSSYENPGHITYKSYSPTPQIALFSEVYYKTWKAYIDGKEAPLLRADYILRALPVPAGEHNIELRCVDEVIVSSAKISLAGSILVGVTLVSLLSLGLYRRFKK